LNFALVWFNLATVWLNLAAGGFDLAAVGVDPTPGWLVFSASSPSF
jgi:hypothetical protein